ncbi:MAG TPA: ParB/RepB/Spo0J family partition protein [Candidatus Dormibacteraeota bacterium]|nr:ParB/RepB/Spo0J family partition protein [Candidatus Dormibacteraeota bacterium]
MTETPGTPAAPGHRRRGLGRGLSALLSSTSVVPAPAGSDESIEGALVEIDISRVAPNPEQPRRDFDARGMEALTDSVRTHGILQPVVVEPDAGGYRLIAGERRLRAAQQAGLTAVPAIIRPATESGRHALELALVENLQRTDLSALEEAAAYARLADTFGLSHEAIGRRVGRSRAAVTNAVRLLALPPPVKESLAAGRITAGHARALLALPSARDQEMLLHEIEEHGLTVRQVERAAQAMPAPGGQPPDTISVPGYAATAAGGVAATKPPVERPASATARRQSVDDVALTRGLEEALGTPVQLQRRRRGGRLVIDFYSDEDLDALYTRLGGPPL